MPSYLIIIEKLYRFSSKKKKKYIITCPTSGDQYIPNSSAINSRTIHHRWHQSKASLPLFCPRAKFDGFLPVEEEDSYGSAQQVSAKRFRISSSTRGKDLYTLANIPCARVSSSRARGDLRPRQIYSLARMNWLDVRTRIFPEDRKLGFVLTIERSYFCIGLFENHNYLR